MNNSGGNEAIREHEHELLLPCQKTKKIQEWPRISCENSAPQKELASIGEFLQSTNWSRNEKYGSAEICKSGGYEAICINMVLC